MTLSESHIESSALDWFAGLGYQVLHGPDISHDSNSPERKSYHDVILQQRLTSSLVRINPQLPRDAITEALRKLKTPPHPSLIQNNHELHKYMRDGFSVACKQLDGSQGYKHVNVFDFENVDNNDFLACNQFTIIEGRVNRRPDTIIFINGLPIAIFEFKNPNSQKAMLVDAFQQLQTYKQELTQLFIYNVALIVSDGIEAAMGSLTSSRERFMPWKTIDGHNMATGKDLGLEVLIKGVFNRRNILDYLRHFVLFEEESDGALTKKLAAYHQFYAVQKAVNATVAACDGDRKAGVVWHTQGSGKSLTMAFYAGALMQHPQMDNPTLVVITDRNDLDEQLFNTFARNKEILREAPKRAENREHLQKLLFDRASGGVIFTTIQKFLPEAKGEAFGCLSNRKNIVVIADEAHRSQYGFRSKLDSKTGELTSGFAQHMRDALPQASFIGFTGTPVELGDKNTRAVFGSYIDVYDIQQAVEDKATVPIYYESQLAKLRFKIDSAAALDPKFEEVTEGEEETSKQKLKSKWSQLEALVGADARLDEVAASIVQHFETRQRMIGGGKGMIVCMSRRICELLYRKLIHLRPKWQHSDDAHGKLKAIMTGSAADKEELRPHIRNKARLNELAKRFRDPNDPFQIVIVRDMWLTGFDAPCLHTLYVDKPMQSHNLMQAVARVNRVFKNKEGGLVVDYIGIADSLKSALNNYTANQGRGTLYLDQEEALEVLRVKFEVVSQMFHGFPITHWKSSQPSERLAMLPAAKEHILAQDDGKSRFLKASLELNKAYSLVAAHLEAVAIRDDVAFFATIRNILGQISSMGTKTQEDMEFQLRQLVSEAIGSDGMLDIFEAAGVKKPDLSILSDEFLSEIQNMPHKNLAVELLARLLHNEVKVRTKRNLIQSKAFSQMLEQALKKYQNRTVEASQVIAELISMVKDFRAAIERGDKLGLTSDEVAFYDALEVSDSAVQLMGGETLITIARDLVREIKASIKIDWTVKESIRAAMRIKIKRLLRKYGYPPDRQEKATHTVLQQAELMCGDWAFE